MSGIIKQESQQITAQQMISHAIEKGAGIEQLEKLMEMQERWEANEAKKAYVDAMNRFRAQCPTIAKTREGHNSKYAGLAETIEQIKGLLAECGLSHSWKTGSADGGITVTCCVTHVAGHQECTSLTAPPDESGKKNAIQSMASTVSYLERYTFYALLGLASAEMDDDGNMAHGKVEYITEEQIAEIEALAEEVGAKTTAVCAFYGAKHLGVFPAKHFDDAVIKLEAKRKESA